MKYKILIIDDEEMILSMMEKMFRGGIFRIYGGKCKKSVRTIKCNTRYYIVGYQYARNGWAGVVPAYPRAYILPDYFFDSTGNGTGCDKRAVCRRG